MTNPTDNWNNYQDALEQLTQKKWTEQELRYLQGAYLTTEPMWFEEVMKISAPRIVLLGEAPLFGKQKKYIYNSQIPPTAFLRPSDFASFPADGARSNKCDLLRLMHESGIVVIDAFPFALNTSDTLTLNFRVMKRSSKIYQKLLSHVFEAHVASKISMLNKDMRKLKILVRYRGMMKPIIPLLEDMGFSEANGSIKCAGSRNHGIDKAIFAEALMYK